MLRRSKHVGKGLCANVFTCCIGVNALAYAPRTPFEYLRMTPLIEFCNKTRVSDIKYL
jgi:hypothetical protein